MAALFEEKLQQDIDNLRANVIEMGRQVGEALEAALRAIANNDHQLAYTVILRDRDIDELEQKIDKLCQDFLIRQLPAAGHLRLVYAVIKINSELERVGDYAESVARQYLSIGPLDPPPSFDKFIEIGNVAIPMLRNAVKAFADEDAELAKATKRLENKVDDMRYEIHNDLVDLRDARTLPSEALPPLMIIASRFERVADQACNICEEVLFMCTGENVKHEGKSVIRMLFVDERDSCRAQMAEGIGNAMGLDRFRFNSAGISPTPVDPKTIRFMKEKGIDISDHTSKYLNQIPDFEYYQVIVALCKEAEVAFPAPPTKTVSIPWNIEDPSEFEGSEEEIQAVYEKTYQYIKTHIHDLVQAILGDEVKVN